MPSGRSQLSLGLRIPTSRNWQALGKGNEALYVLGGLSSRKEAKALLWLLDGCAEEYAKARLGHHQLPSEGESFRWSSSQPRPRLGAIATAVHSEDEDSERSCGTPYRQRGGHPRKPSSSKPVERSTCRGQPTLPEVSSQGSLTFCETLHNVIQTAIRPRYRPQRCEH